MTRSPRWAAFLLRALAPRGEADDVLGDLEEAHRVRLQHYSAPTACTLTAIEAIDVAAALIRTRLARLRIRENGTVHDYKLGFRMLVKYPGLTLAGGLALAIAIGIGAGWYDAVGDVLRPRLPLPGGDRIVEIEMRNQMAGRDEQRLLHDFAAWRRDLTSVEELGAYRTVERNLVLGDARPEPVTVVEISASAFRVANVPPLAGRPLLDSDEQPGAAPVVVLGHDVWRQRFGGRRDAIGETLRLGQTPATIVGVMPEGFAFPVNHRLWVPLQIRQSGYAPLEGPLIRVFGRLKPGITQAEANAEVSALATRAAADSPATHERLRPRILAYGGESPGDRSWLEFLVTHGPILLVLVVACVNVGTLIYARTATRDAEIAMRYALGASRERIVAQLFVEALVLASVAAVIGLAVADRALKWGLTAYYAGQDGGAPFWVNPGLKLSTVLYALGLTVVGAAVLGVLPAIKATGLQVQAHLRTVGAGGSTLRFGGVWTTAMIAQVALTVICLPPAMGITQEVRRDRAIRSRFPARQYLAVRVELDRDSTPPADQTYRELERRVAQLPGVVATRFADRLPGMGVAVRSAEVEVSSETAPRLVENLWTSAVEPRFFELFDTPIVAGRDFHEGDRVAGAQTALVNEAFARQLPGASAIGRRVRFASSDPTKPEPWFEIVGVVRDIGMTPTDAGEAPYLFRAASPLTTFPLVIGVRVAGDPAALAPRIRAIAADLDAGLRVDEIRALDEHVWRVELPGMIAAGTIAGVVGLGLFLSAAGIFSLMSVSIARRRREIGVRAALGASRARLIAGIFSRALILVGSGVVAGNAVIVFVVALSEEARIADVAGALLVTSAVMLTVGLLACVEPARRALRIEPSEALKEA